MALDPYSQCPDGTGVKLKFSPSAAAFEQAAKIEKLVEAGQEENALKAIDKLAEDESADEAFLMYLETIRARALASFRKFEEGLKAADAAAGRFADYGLPHDVLADFSFSIQDYETAAEGYERAVFNYPPEATEHLCRAYLKLGFCRNFRGKPLAAWACWRRAQKIDASFSAAEEALKNYVEENRLLPAAARRGLELLPPNEEALADETKKARWERALSPRGDATIDDLVAIFERLVSDDPDDARAWYDLALASAWKGSNLRAIEAFDEYVRREPDFERSAAAWDVCEVLRFGAGAEEVCDHLHYVATYAVADPEKFMDRLKNCKHVMVVAEGEDRTPSLHWMDKEVDPNQDAGAPIIGGPSRQLAQVLLGPDSVEIVATAPEALAETTAKFDVVVGETATPLEKSDRPGPVQTLDAEPFLVFHPKGAADETKAKRTLEEVTAYFEQRWIARPLRSLGGLAPVDAAEGEVDRKKLEGALRFRERNFARYDSAYNFDRLRNKLKLPFAGDGPEIAEDGAADENVDVSAYSAEQLAKLDPAKLTTDDLLAAYRAAKGLDAPATAAGFVDALLERGEAADGVDLAPILESRVRYAVENKDDDVDALIERCAAFDEKTAGGAARMRFELLKAGRAPAGEERVAAYRSVFENAASDLESAARAVEGLLGAAAYAEALELAEAGVKRAEQARDGDFQGRFREYAEEASARAK